MGPGNRTLACLARTTRAFEGPALDALWRTQKSLVPLLKLMPPDMWTVTREINGHMRINRLVWNLNYTLLLCL
jgi:hypothetical protein